MSIEIIAYTQAHETAWEGFCAGAVNSTLLHTRGFLSYHVDRFKDLSVLIMQSGKLVGVFPAAESPSDTTLVISHPGITYGGIVHQGWLSGTRMIEVLTALAEYYGKNGYQRLQYKPVPFIYTKTPAQDDLYALFRLGAQRIRCDLSCTIDLTNRQPLSERRRRGLKKALKAVTLSSDPALLGELWAVIAQNLAHKHNAKPVHSLAELTLLKDRFSQLITIRCALMDGHVEAGVVFFNSPSIWHAQYIAASEIAYNVSALDAVFDSAITDAQQVGVRYFDFGTSNEDGGKVLNDGLYRFKSEFGGGGIAHEYYEVNLC
ncbi:GNAT family N-acetyltransferase [Methylobacter sp. S3L5C]|uniref:GNAT family N-acetyltransferase n=1 Tax=Methylobacter sp. S3L5C TaxID=2839024 RepID=UPI001FAB6036|nr:GNAT family N-acetyltransferase [Methylobacter sp. S3L5C]UOA09532.1 GNAT family N-acetyltransferase [Methylobacter sp. S3L5C]